MNYTKIEWKDLPDTSTPITASNLNNMENGIEWLFENNNGAPIGTVMMFAGNTAPSGFKICDGSAISRSTYSSLFNIIGTSFGSGDGSTTFNLPNLKGKIPVGLDSEDTDFEILGKTGGEKTHTLTVNEMPQHSHSFGGYKGSTQWADGQIWYRAGGVNTDNTPATTNTTDSGGNQPHNIVQPYLVLNYIIKVS